MTAKIDWYREVLELEPNSKVFFPLARLLADSGERDEAIRLLENGLGRHPEYLEARLFRIELLYQAGRKEECNTEIARLSKMFASYAGFWQAWAACLASEQGESDTASLIRFLAAHFISGPLHFHEVINRGLDAVLREQHRAVPEATASQKTEPAEEKEVAAATEPESEAFEEQPSTAPEEPGDGILMQPGHDASAESATAPGPEISDLTDEAPEAFLSHTSEMLADLDSELEESEPEASSEPAEIAPEQSQELSERMIQTSAEVEESAEPEFPSANPGGDALTDEADSAESLAQHVQELAAASSAEESMEAVGSIDTLMDSEEAPAFDSAEAAAELPVEEEAAPVEDPGPESAVEAMMAEAVSFEPAVGHAEREMEAGPEIAVPEAMQEPSADEPEEALAQGILDEPALEADSQLDLPETLEDASLSFQVEAELGQAAVIEADKAEAQGKAPGSLAEAEAAMVAGLDLPDMDAAPDVSLTQESAPVEANEEPEEPFSLRTRSMAEVLAEQGDIQGALDIYEELAAAATSSDEVEDINRRISTLRGRLSVANASAEFNAAEEASANRNKEKLIEMLEALAQRVEARAQ